MRTHETLNSEFGSYLFELARRAIASDREPAHLACASETYRQCKAATVDGSPDLSPMMALLEANPPLQEQLAFFLDYIPSRWLLEAEIPAIKERRRQRGAPSSQDENDAYQWARKNKLAGLCLSGGGIRSATFNLGILQGLAGLGILGQFDYLSSVSGGGYIHEWLASWIKREDEGRGSVRVQNNFASGLDAVQDRIKPIPFDANHPFSPEPIRWLRRFSNYLTPHKGLFTADTWVAIAIWFRNTFLNQIILVSLLFSLVLLPHLIGEGFRSAKTLTAPVPALSAKLASLASHVQGHPQWWGGSALILFVLASMTLWVGLRNEYTRVRSFDMYGSDDRKEPRLGEGGALGLVILPLLVACCFLVVALLEGLPKAATLKTLGIAMAVQLAGMALAGGSARVYLINHGRVPDSTPSPAAKQEPIGFGRHLLRAAQSAWYFVHGTLLLVVPAGTKGKHQERADDAASKWRVFFVAILGSSGVNSVLAAAGGVGVFLVVAGLLQFPTFLVHRLTLSLPVWANAQGELPALRRFQLTLGPPLLLFVPFFSMILMAGLVGRNFDDWLREWIARVRAWCLLVSIGWTVYFGISLLGPWLFSWAAMEYHHHPHMISSIKWTSVLGWIGATAGSVLAGKSKKSSGAADDSSAGLNAIARVGPWVFILGLLLLLSRAADWSFENLHQQHPMLLPLLLVIPLAIFLLFGWRVDVNDFSMNSFYRNRLTRCYLGATNPLRDPNPLTGFDDRDTRGLQISKLQPSENYSGPLPIINTTLNLSFGEDLAYQERKAASFFFSPLFSGYTVGWTSAKQGRRLSFNGFVPTSHYYADGGINIATAVSISGAAASPNWGFHTNPGTAFLMTLFNVRLGWWIFNPRRSQLAGCLSVCSDSKPDWPSPRFAPLQLARELLGMADDTSKYVYLSDGGHFDNMGLYELVRRRCHRIVICDAECDDTYAFEGLAMAIRKARIDFGVEILLPEISRLRQRMKSGDCKAHFVTGAIRYPESPADTNEWGTIIYIKSSLTGNAKFEPDPRDHPGTIVSLDAESVDILNYKLQHSSFPHDTTANQWFTESQFESYRRLGQHVIEEIESCSGWKDFVTAAAPASTAPPPPHVPQPGASEPVLLGTNGRDGDGSSAGASFHR